MISDLEDRRDAVLGELERLASGITGAAIQHRTQPAAAAESADRDSDEGSDKDSDEEAAAKAASAE